VDEATLALRAQQRALAAESAALAKAALDASATLQTYEQVRVDAADAAENARDAVRQSAAAARAVVAARGDLRSYAGSLYRFGRVDPRLLIVSAALESTQPQQFFAGLDMARQVGDYRSRMVTSMGAAEAEQAAAAVAAQDAARQQAAAALHAAAANEAAKQAVAAYRAQVVARRQQLAVSSTVLQRAKLRAAQLDSAAATVGVTGWPTLPACPGGDLAGFDNGRLPLTALCPVLFGHGLLLRADADYAFNSMATEYAATFGTPLCVTDAYRSYDAQVAVADEKPLLAAHPGRSNHGWGIATDLCGGIQSFDTPQHQWMLDNAMLFGWFHPAWAEPTGSKPEPWHWEFAG
jgi:hypothetical protein